MMKATTLLFMSMLFSLGTLAAQPEKEWTFLVFLNGHNNLSSFGDMNIRDMEKVGSTKDINILVEWGSETTTKTRRLYVQKSTNSAQVTSPVVLENDNYDMGNYKNLVEFVKWGIQNYPAKHYFVSVWNHGSGWNRQVLVSPKDISYDDHSGNKITTEQLGLAMSEIKQYLGRNIDIYGSDACLMQMVEVAGEMKGDVNYFVGSQDLEPGEGWPYAPFLKKWAGQPTMTPAQVSVLLSKEYLAAYSTGGVYSRRDVTFAVWDMAGLDGLYAGMTDLRKDMTGLGTADFTAVKKASQYAQNFACSGCADLGDFVKKLKSVPSMKSKASVSQVEKAIQKLVLSTDNSDEFRNSTGISVWLPSYKSPEMQNRYDNLKFSVATGWNIFTKMLTP